MKRNPGATIVALLTLALGIGANSALFSVFHAVILEPLPFPQADRIVIIYETDANRGVYTGTASPAEFLDWKERIHSFEELSAWQGQLFTITGGEPEQLWGAQCTADLFTLFRVGPQLGRAFLAEEEQPGHENVVVISYGLWQRRLHGNPRALGSSLIIDGRPYTVVGVLPSGFSLFGFGREYEVWMPFAFARAQLRREDHRLIVFGRLKTGVALDAAQVEMAGIQESLKKIYPGVDMQNGMRVVPFERELTRRIRPHVLLLAGAVGCLLLIACANVANLLLARAISREREMAVRLALGGSRLRILRQLLTESAFLSLCGALPGLFLAQVCLRLLRAAVAQEGVASGIPHASRLGVELNVLLFTLALSFLTGLLFGVAPAAHVLGGRLAGKMKEGGHGSAGGGHRWMRGLLVISEVAVSLVLLACAGLLARSFFAMARQDLGFRPEGLLTMRVLLPGERYSDPARVRNFYSGVLARISALPGVNSVSAINFLPVTRWTDFCNFEVQGRGPAPPDSANTAHYAVIDSAYLKTLGIPVKQGRDFTPSDTENAPGVVLISEAVAQRYWPGANPVGERIRLQTTPSPDPWRFAADDSWLTIVGVTGEIIDWQLQGPKIGQIYLPFLQHPVQMMSLVIRTGGDPAALSLAARQAVFSADPNQPVTDVETMEEYLSAALTDRRGSMVLLGVFSILATALAAIGIYGVLSYLVNEQTREIGVRVALGAQSSDILRLILRKGMRLVGIGLLLGVVTAVAGRKVLASLLYGIAPGDPLTLAAMSLLLLGVALAACVVPARRASRMDPIVALREE